MAGAPQRLTYWLRWGLLNFLPRLASICDPPDLYLSGWDYWHELPCLVSTHSSCCELSNLPLLAQDTSDFYLLRPHPHQKPLLSDYGPHPGVGSLEAWSSTLTSLVQLTSSTVNRRREGTSSAWRCLRLSPASLWLGYATRWPSKVSQGVVRTSEFLPSAESSLDVPSAAQSPSARLLQASLASALSPLGPALARTSASTLAQP
jgi:hypothetical protein